MLVCLPLPGSADSGPGVVASIKPVQALVAASCRALANCATDQRRRFPHDYSLRPSEVQSLNQAQVVFWIGPELETFLPNPGNAAGVRSVELLRARRGDLPLRQGGNWEPHGHHDASTTTRKRKRPSA